MAKQYFRHKQVPDSNPTRALALGALVGDEGVIDVYLCVPVGPKSKQCHKIVLEMPVDAAEAFAQEILDEVAAVRTMVTENLKRK